MALKASKWPGSLRQNRWNATIVLLFLFWLLPLDQPGLFFGYVGFQSARNRVCSGGVWSSAQARTLAGQKPKMAHLYSACRLMCRSMCVNQAMVGGSCSRFCFELARGHSRECPPGSFPVETFRAVSVFAMRILNEWSGKSTLHQKRKKAESTFVREVQSHFRASSEKWGYPRPSLR